MCLTTLICWHCPSNLISAYSRLLVDQHLVLNIGTFTWMHYLIAYSIVQKKCKRNLAKFTKIRQSWQKRYFAAIMRKFEGNLEHSVIV